MTHRDVFGYPTLTPAPAGWGTTITSTAPILNMTPGQRLTLVAHHEAAHVIVTRDGGGVAGGVVYHGWDASEGAASTESMTGPRDVVLVAVAAGWRAEVGWMREQGLWTPAREWVAERRNDADREQFDQLVTDNRDAAWEQLSARADVALAHRWDEVVRVASVLESAWSSGQWSVSPEELSV